MSGFEAFIQLFGDITVLDVVLFIAAAGFVIAIAVQALRLLSKKIKEHEAREEEWKQTVEATKHYPEYREQSIKIQEGFKKEINELRSLYTKLEQKVDRQDAYLNKVEEDNKRRERNKIRDILLQYYKRYGDPTNNPSKTWTRIESETFWELFKDYEGLDGDGYMHSDVEPVMRLLDVI